MKKVEESGIKLYSESDGYLLVYSGKSNLKRHPSGEIISYDVSENDIFIINGPQKSIKIRIDEELIMKRNIFIGSEVSGF